MDLPSVIHTSSGGVGSTASYLPQLESPWEIYRKKRTIPIPEALFNHFRTASTQTVLGLFPELDRAWITVDEKLFIWDYQHG
jgi:nuclear pore complex protein Nup155